MLRSLNASRSSLSRTVARSAASQRRTFIPSASRSADLVQDIYVKAINAYKPTPTKASDSEGHVQKFSMPKAPASPEESNIANDLKAYEDQQVEVEGSTADGEAAVEEDWFEEEPEEDETKSAH
ncbi:hypothetical protein MMC10_002117 [Thelotrema lepadinum]|nr:hypothetical protein [Thelotrema lepadinum]